MVINTIYRAILELEDCKGPLDHQEKR